MKKKIPDPNTMKKIKGPKLSSEELKAAKIRVTTYLDADVLNALRETAEESSSKYQTMLNQILRQALMGKEDNTLLKRLEKLEDEVFKKKRVA